MNEHAEQIKTMMTSHMAQEPGCIQTQASSIMTAIEQATGRKMCSLICRNPNAPVSLLNVILPWTEADSSSKIKRTSSHRIGCRLLETTCLGHLSISHLHQDLWTAICQVHMLHPPHSFSHNYLTSLAGVLRRQGGSMKGTGLAFW